MTNKRLAEAIEDILSPKPRTKSEMFFAYLPALVSFVAYLVAFAAVFFGLWVVFRSQRDTAARCNTACVKLGYHGGDLAEDQCICESREILKEGR